VTSRAALLFFSQSHLLGELLREQLLSLSPRKNKDRSPIPYSLLCHVTRRLDAASDQRDLTDEGNVKENGGREGANLWEAKVSV
jgi:hypothetical protein